ncbi:GreA/GreB family elongation factor [Geminicoccus roseus]|uniref:GreA/GreB family elongation factor n=1 Tax=Geminicoccus roseus TaxID=404900 RepID=UPI0003F6ACF5|nr:GreA/GreB family elongation factor [Geminicoccus roseus]
MSRAFVKEPDGDAAIDDLPDRTISPNRNLVTPEGYRQIEAALAHWRAEEAGTPSDDRSAHARIARELRYWKARLASAERVEPLARPEQVVFGTEVELRWPDGRLQTLSLVGEDESAPEQGRIAWTAPLASALIGLAEGETARFRDEELEVLAIRPLA